MSCFKHTKIARFSGPLTLNRTKRLTVPPKSQLHCLCTKIKGAFISQTPLPKTGVRKKAPSISLRKVNGNKHQNITSRMVGGILMNKL